MSGLAPGERAFRVDIWVPTEDRWATVGGWCCQFPTFDGADQARERYRAALTRYLDGTRLPDKLYRVVVEGPGPAVDPPSAELEYRRAVPLEPIPPHRWGRFNPPD